MSLLRTSCAKVRIFLLSVVHNWRSVSNPVCTEHNSEDSAKTNHLCNLGQWSLCKKMPLTTCKLHFQVSSLVTDNAGSHKQLVENLLETPIISSSASDCCVDAWISMMLMNSTRLVWRNRWGLKGNKRFLQHTALVCWCQMIPLNNARPTPLPAWLCSEDQDQ